MLAQGLMLLSTSYKIRTGINSKLTLDWCRQLDLWKHWAGKSHPFLSSKAVFCFPLFYYLPTLRALLYSFPSSFVSALRMLCIIFSALFWMLVGDAVAYWSVPSFMERAVRVRALARDIVLCSWARHSTVTVPLSTQEYKWVPANCWGNLTNCGKVTRDGLASRPGGVKTLLVASCYKNRDKLRQLWAGRPPGFTPNAWKRNENYACQFLYTIRNFQPRNSAKVQKALTLARVQNPDFQVNRKYSYTALLLSQY